MAAITYSRLPGIRFEAAPPPLDRKLPRMDVAAFAGFAASGPVGIPVALEDYSRFEEIFGGELRLVWDCNKGSWLKAHLAAAVRDFFRNGGVRCWVLRLAGEDAETSRFPAPGLLSFSGGSVGPAWFAARSPGSWADSWQLSASLLVEPLALVSLNLTQETAVVDGARPGDLLRFRWTSAGTETWLVARVGERLERMTWLRPVEDRTVDVEGAAAGSVVQGADPDGTLWITVEDSYPLARGSGAIVLNGMPDIDMSEQPAVERLTLELRARLEGGYPLRISGLECSSGSARFAGALPTDKQLYGPGPAEDLWSEAAMPRFPFAGAFPQDALLVPITRGGAPPLYAGAQHSGKPALEREGLAGLSEALFLDPALADKRTTTLAAEAEFIRYQSVDPRPLTGIHALWEVEEATLVAVPDAAQPGWVETAAADLAPPAAPPEEVRPTGLFQDCDVIAIARPDLSLSGPDEGGAFSLAWSGEGAEFFELQESGAPDYALARTIYEGADNGIEIRSRVPGDYYYRARGARGELRGPWSNGVAARIEAPGGYAPTWGAPGILPGVQRALLRFCAARGDVFAILTTPPRTEQAAALEYVDALRSSLAGEETAAFSYGAIYHPWIVRADDPFRETPPDGAMAGLYARRALARGGWVAPANEDLREVLALAPAVARQRHLDFEQAQINLIRREPHGFTCLSEQTLSSDPDLRTAHVRRLLILLRRLALREGHTYVFEPNSDAFRRLVQRSFRSVMDVLFERGAFAGRTPASSYRVITDASVNPPQSVEQGRLIVELRVAPSMPLRFLTVRLVQSGAGLMVTEGI